MGRKMLEVKTLYGLSIDNLMEIANNAQNSYTRNLARTVIMRHNGCDNKIIINTLGKSHATITSYINKWNTLGPEALIDQRGDNVPSSLTDEMVNDIRNIVTNTVPSDFGYEQNKWNCVILTRYVEDKYGKTYSDTWLRQTLKNLDFTYKRGVYKPTLANPDLQESFKKNV
jgi:transposase